MNNNAKTRNFAWLVAAALVLLLVAGVTRSWWAPLENQQLPNAGTDRAVETWDAHSLTPESRLADAPAMRLTPVPPLPDENQKIEFKRLPQTNRGLGQVASQVEIGSASDGRPSMQFKPLPGIDRIETRALPRIDRIGTHALPKLPADSSHDAKASHEEFTPLPSMKGIKTHALPQLPVESPSDAQAIPLESTPASPTDEVPALDQSPQTDVKFKDLPLPPVGDQTKVTHSAVPEFGFVKRLPKSDLFCQRRVG